MAEAAPPEAEGLELLSAAEQGQAARLRELLGAGADAAFQEAEGGRSALMAAAGGGHVEAVGLLLEAGAPWNALDKEGRCAGDFAASAGHQEAVDALLDAGTRAELILGAAMRASSDALPRDEGYLQGHVTYEEGRLLDESRRGVMMQWEKGLMEAHAAAVCPREGLAILNVGFGMGLFDTAVQRRAPARHAIIEAHPEVQARMREEGWHQRPGVEPHFSRWQDCLAGLPDASFDGIFFDTFGEHYEDQRQFHAHVPRLLKADGVYSFFNGFCADQPFFHAVACQVTALELQALGLQCDFIPLPVRQCLDADTWDTISLKYWQLDVYNLPVAYMASEEEEPLEGGVTAADEVPQDKNES